MLRCPPFGGLVDANKKQRQAITGLRNSDATTLGVLTQDALRSTLGRLEPGTLCDLLALSEVQDGLGVGLARDLGHFREQTLREISDLPDGPALADFANELAEVAPARVPACLRTHLASLIPDRRHTGALEALQAALSAFEAEDPGTVTVRPPAAPRASKSPTSAPGRTRREVVKPATAPRVRRAATPAPMLDTRRAEWIEEDALSRLRQYGANGLKEAIIVAGCQHRAPWQDLAESEILAVLRKLGRDGVIRHTSNRWMMAGRG